MVSAVLRCIGISWGLLRGSGQAHSRGSGLNLEIWTFCLYIVLLFTYIASSRQLAQAWSQIAYSKRLNVSAPSPPKAKSQKPHNVILTPLCWSKQLTAQFQIPGEGNRFPLNLKDRTSKVTCKGASVQGWQGFSWPSVQTIYCRKTVHYAKERVDIFQMISLLKCSSYMKIIL